jgi:hypothetical protein
MAAAGQLVKLSVAAHAGQAETRTCGAARIVIAVDTPPK